MAEVAILEEDLATFPYILDVAFGIRIPRVIFFAVDVLHEPAHVLDHNMGVSIALVVFSFWIDTIRVLRGLQNKRFAMHLGRRWRSRMHSA